MLAQKEAVKLDWTVVGSSNVKAVAYHEGSKTLAVQFNNGGQYSYESVDMDVYVDLVHAESVGRYLNNHVKGGYTYLKWFNEQELLTYITERAPRKA